MFTCPNCLSSAQGAMGRCSACGFDARAFAIERERHFADKSDREAERRQQEAAGQLENWRRRVQWLQSLPETIRSALTKAQSDTPVVEVIAAVAEKLKDVDDEDWLLLSREMPHEGAVSYKKLQDLLGPEIKMWWDRRAQLSPSPIPMLKAIAKPLIYRDLAAAVYLHTEYARIQKETDRAVLAARTEQEQTRAALSEAVERLARQAAVTAKAHEAVALAENRLALPLDEAEIEKQARSQDRFTSAGMGMGAAIWIGVALAGGENAFVTLTFIAIGSGFAWGAFRRWRKASYPTAADVQEMIKAHKEELKKALVDATHKADKASTGYEECEVARRQVAAREEALNSQIKALVREREQAAASLRETSYDPVFLAIAEA